MHMVTPSSWNRMFSCAHLETVSDHFGQMRCTATGCDPVAVGLWQLHLCQHDKRHRGYGVAAGCSSRFCPDPADVSEHYTHRRQGLAAVVDAFWQMG